MTDSGRTVLMPRARVAVGTQLNGIYRIDTPIAAGGMGEVYKGYNIQTGDPVAIKMIRSDLAENESALGLFRKEALALGNLHHEAIVRYYIFAVDPALNRAYLAMEYVDGISLKDMLVRGPLPYEQVRILQTRLAAGLHAAHKVGIIHRDVSPDNVLAPSGDLSQAKILDFGIARSTKAGEQTIIGSGFAGKFNYVSPEQLGMFGGDVTGKSDIYSLGLLLAECLLGRPLDMGGTQVDVIDKRRMVPDLSAIDARLRPLIAEMLSPHPDDRPENMAAVAEWEPSKKGKTKPPKAMTGGASSGSADKSKMPMIAAAAVVLLGLGGGGAYFASNMIGGGSSSQLAQEERQAQERAEVLRRREQEDKRLADIQKQEAERKAEEARKAEEEQRAAALRKQEEELQAATRLRQDNERRTAEQRRQEEARKAAEAKRLEDERKAAEAKRIEDEKKAAEAKRIEDEKKAAEAKRIEDERKAEEERRLAEQRRIEDDRKREEARLAEEQSRKEAEARKLADEQKAAAERKLAEEQAAAQKAEDEKMRLAQEAARARWDAELAAAMVRQGITPNANSAAPGAGQQVALADPAAAKPASDPATTTRGVQSQLARLGCFAGAVDGQTSKVLDEAISRYRKRTGIAGTANPADELLLQELQLQGAPQSSCECLKGQTPQKNNCVATPRKKPEKKKQTVRRPEPARQPPRRQQVERPAPRPAAPARPNIGGIGF